MEKKQNIFTDSAKLASIVSVTLLYALYFSKLRYTSCLWDSSDALNFTSLIVLSALVVIFPVALITSVVSRRLSFALTGALASFLATYLVSRWFLINEKVVIQYALIACISGFLSLLIFASSKPKVGIFWTFFILGALGFPFLVKLTHMGVKDGIKIFFAIVAGLSLILGRSKIAKLFVVLIYIAAGYGAFSLWQNVHYPTFSPISKFDGKNLILITIDALRADAIEPYNSSYKTPAFAHFANRSLIFERAYSNSPWTMPSLASIFSGLNPRAHGCSEPEGCLAKEVNSLAELLKNKGFKTIAVVYQPLFEVPTGFERGFESFSVITCHPIELYKKYFYPISKYAEKFFDGFPLLTELTTIVALKKLKSQNSPFYLWIHHYDPHSPYSPPKRFFELVEKPKEVINLPEHQIGFPTSIHSELLQKHQSTSPPPKPHEIKYVRDMYQAEVNFVDSQLNILFNFLESTGLASSTYIILTADHGEEFYEHSGWDHGRTLYKEVLHIPLMISGPNIAHSKSACFATNVDVFATALRLLDIAQPTSQGTDLIELAQAQNCLKRELVFSTAFAEDVERDAILSFPHKLIYPPTELYKVDEDPLEQREISAQKANVARELKLKLQEKVAEDYRTFQELGIKPSHKNANKIQRELLKSLGYVQ